MYSRQVIADTGPHATCEVPDELAAVAPRDQVRSRRVVVRATAKSRPPLRVEEVRLRDPTVEDRVEIGERDELRFRVVVDEELRVALADVLGVFRRPTVRCVTPLR